MEAKLITSDLIIADVFDRWPETVEVFLDRRMSCPGCFMARFDTLDDALQIYALPEDAFLRELNRSACPEGESLLKEE